VSEETLDAVRDAFHTVGGNQLALPHMNFAYLRAQW
jgi:hypothetical protein